MIVYLEQNMRILITGATGFLGSYLTADLIAEGHEVIVLVRRDSDAWRLDGIKDHLEILTGSLDDAQSLRSALTHSRPHAVAHLAWSGVANTARNHASQALNVATTVTFAELAAEYGVGVFIGAGSQAEYGPHKAIIAENAATNPTTLYGLAKLAAGNMVAQLARERGVRFAWMRIFSTYGPKDAEHWLIPSVIRAFQSRKPMQLTACEQRWSFLHARDAAASFRVALLNAQAEGVYNVGSPEAPPLRETVSSLRDLVDPRAELAFGEIAYRPDQVMLLQPDIRRLAGLGWRPTVPLMDGLKETVEWYNDRAG